MTSTYPIQHPMVVNHEDLSKFAEVMIVPDEVKIVAQLDTGAAVNVKVNSFSIQQLVRRQKGSDKDDGI